MVWLFLVVVVVFARDYPHAGVRDRGHVVFLCRDPSSSSFHGNYIITDNTQTRNPVGQLRANIIDREYRERHRDGTGFSREIMPACRALEKL